MKLDKHGSRLVWIITIPLLLFISAAIFIEFPTKFSGNTSTLNNLMSPVTAVVITVLTYSVFIFQNEFGKKQELSQHTNSIDSYIKETIDLINDIEWNGKRGIVAIREFNMDIKTENGTEIIHTFYDELSSVLIRIKDIESLIGLIEDKTINGIYYNRLYTLFYSKILWNVNKSYFDGQQAVRLVRDHDDSPLTIELYIQLSDRCLSYLISNKLISNSEYKKRFLLKIKTFLEQNNSFIEAAKNNHLTSS